MKISAYLIQAYHICPRQAWLMSRSLRADQEHDDLAIGRLIDDTSYTRDSKSIYLPQISAKLDLVRKKNGEIEIIEIKKTSKTLESGKKQLLYYLYQLKKLDINATGTIRIPKEKIVQEVNLSQEDCLKIENLLVKIGEILGQDKPPPVKRIKQCPKCAHFDFCWA